MESDRIRIPGISDREVRRFRVFCFDFDARANILADEPKESWSQEAKVQWQTSRDSLIESLKREFGAHDIDRKVADFAALGTKPFSIIAHHNALFDQVRSAFVSGGYYAALTSACALGERILNHLVLDLRDAYKASPSYRHVCRKDSFDRWPTAIDALVEWDVLLPGPASEFRDLEKLRHRSIHFNPETTSRLREDALQAIGHVRSIIDGQFASIGLQPWFIEGILGASFIKREWEDRPFVAQYYLQRNVCVGPFHSIEQGVGGWRFVDHPDYGVFGVDSLTDEQFKDLFNNSDPSTRARSAEPAEGGAVAVS